VIYDEIEVSLYISFYFIGVFSNFCIYIFYINDEYLSVQLQINRLNNELNDTEMQFQKVAFQLNDPILDNKSEFMPNHKNVDKVLLTAAHLKLKNVAQSSSEINSRLSHLNNILGNISYIWIFFVFILVVLMVPLILISINIILKVIVYFLTFSPKGVYGSVGIICFILSNILFFIATFI